MTSLIYNITCTKDSPSYTTDINDLPCYIRDTTDLPCYTTDIKDLPCYTTDIKDLPSYTTEINGTSYTSDVNNDLPIPKNTLAVIYTKRKRM